MGELGATFGVEIRDPPMQDGTEDGDAEPVCLYIDERLGKRRGWANADSRFMPET